MKNKLESMEDVDENTIYINQPSIEKENNLNQNNVKIKSQSLSRTRNKHSSFSPIFTNDKNRISNILNKKSKRFFIVQEVSTRPSSTLYPFVYNDSKKNKNYFFENPNLHKLLTEFSNNNETNRQKIIKINLKKSIERNNKESNEISAIKTEVKNKKLHSNLLDYIQNKTPKNFCAYNISFLKDNSVYRKNIRNNSQNIKESSKIKHKKHTTLDFNNFSTAVENIKNSKNKILDTPNNQKIENGINFSEFSKKNKNFLNFNGEVKNENIYLKTQYGKEKFFNEDNSKKNYIKNKKVNLFLNSNCNKKDTINSGSYSLANENNGKSNINEDAFVIKENIFGEKYNFYGIFDGHGENSHLISKFLSKVLGKFFSNKNIYQKYMYKLLDNISDYSADEEGAYNEIIINNKVIKKILLENDYYFIKNIIKSAEKELITKNYDLKLSGSTSVLLFLIKNIIICANIGDSKCVLYKCSENCKWSYINLSSLHHPDVKSEKARIYFHGGKIHPKLNEYNIPEDNIQRIWLNNEKYPGLPMSRAIGDLVAKKIGVISEPSFVCKKIDLRSKFIVLGSSGFWNVMNNTDIIYTVKPFLLYFDADSAAKALIDKAKKCWDDIGKKRDDITVIVIFLHPYGVL